MAGLSLQTASAWISKPQDSFGLDMGVRVGACSATHKSPSLAPRTPEVLPATTNPNRQHPLWRTPTPLCNPLRHLDSLQRTHFPHLRPPHVAPGFTTAHTLLPPEAPALGTAEVLLWLRASLGHGLFQGGPAFPRRLCRLHWHPSHTSSSLLLPQWGSGPSQA